jgi:hypothetical protein
MPGGVQGAGMQVADAKAFLIDEQHIELAAVAGEPGLGIEQRAEHFLHLGDLRTDAGMAAELFLEVGAADRWSACTWVSRIH